MLGMHLAQLWCRAELKRSVNGWRCYFRGLLAKILSRTAFCLMDGLFQIPVVLASDRGSFWKCPWKECVLAS